MAVVAYRPDERSATAGSSPADRLFILGEIVSIKIKKIAEVIVVVWVVFTTLDWLVVFRGDSLLSVLKNQWQWLIELRLW